MELNENKIDQLYEIFDDFNFLNSKQIKKIIDHLINNKDKSIENIDKLKSLIKEVYPCKLCTSYCLNSDLCNICNSTSRDKKLLIVESKEQIKKIEQHNLYNGKYFVIPILFTKKFNKINYDFSKLHSYINEFNEIIIGVNSTQEGILTSNLIYDEIKSNNQNIKITKLAIGLPFGSNIDYVDQFTLSYAIKNRKDVE